ncbi:Uncharacterized protein HZ326_24906 [Fusarium oxysporum f. sp. albedinis]|nr:Uncharacterized protein HZ326_24906 [Fusarium oxysporum f. sp. albedinis]
MYLCLMTVKEIAYYPTLSADSISRLDIERKIPLTPLRWQLVVSEVKNYKSQSFALQWLPSSSQHPHHPSHSPSNNQNPKTNLGLGINEPTSTFTMKFSILTFFLTFAACVYAVAIALPEDLEREAIRAIQSGDIVPVEHPDSRQELQVYENGVLQGTVVVTQEGEVVRAFDADGNEISAAELDVEEADARTIQKRWITLAFRAAWLIGKYAAKGGKLFKRLKTHKIYASISKLILPSKRKPGPDPPKVTLRGPGFHYAIGPSFKRAPDIFGIRLRRTRTSYDA